MTEGGSGTGSLEATARWTAAVRAAESARADDLVRDPWAGALAGPDGMAWTAERTPESVLPIVLRTRYFDDWLVGILAGGAIRQAVLLAAGLDTRAFRLTCAAGARCFEVDRRAVLGHKAAILEGPGRDHDATGGRSRRTSRHRGATRSRRPGSTPRGPRRGSSRGSCSTCRTTSSGACSTA